MLTKLTIRNFKLFDDVELELADRVVLVGPNNAGKTSALQALALWDVGVKRWSEKRGSGAVKRPGVTINRRDLITAPVPAANLLWRDLHTQESGWESGRQKVEKVFIQIIVEGVSGAKNWRCGLEFYYANEESFYCKPLMQDVGGRFDVPLEAIDVGIAYLPPMSGLSSAETRLDQGAVNVRLGEGRTAEVLRNLCYQVLQGPQGADKWKRLTQRVESLFGIHLDKPKYIKERGEIVLSYETPRRIRLDISSSGRGQQQMLLLLAHMTANPGSVLLLDEPDAHLEILRQRQMYQVLTDAAAETGNQIIAASHSEVLLNEAGDRDVVIAFVGRPHRIDDRGAQVLKALKEIGFEHYYQAEEVGWVLYLEGSTDLAILRALAIRLGHVAAKCLDRPFVHYVGNQPRKAQDHFYGVREAKSDLAGIAIYDRLPTAPPSDPNLIQLTWQKRELENYLCQRDTLLAFADAQGLALGARASRPPAQRGSLVMHGWRTKMEESIVEIEQALAVLGEPSPWSSDIKATDGFLDRVFPKFYDKLGLPNLMRKTDYHTLAPYVAKDAIDAEISEKLDQIVAASKRARPRTA